MSGHIVSGTGAAANLLHLQRPLLRGFLLDIENCQIGTVNVQLDHALDIKIPDIVTPFVLDRRLEAIRYFASDLPVVPMRRRHVRLRRIPNQRHLPRIPRSHEGRFAIVTDVGRGKRWTRVAQKTNAREADGEVVWF